MTTFRDKYVKDYLEFILRFKHYLTPWESDFIANVQKWDPNRLTPRQFNRLKEISERITAEVA